MENGSTGDAYLMVGHPQLRQWDCDVTFSSQRANVITVRQVKVNEPLMAPVTIDIVYDIYKSLSIRTLQKEGTLCPKLDPISIKKSFSLKEEKLRNKAKSKERESKWTGTSVDMTNLSDEERVTLQKLLQWTSDDNHKPKPHSNESLAKKQCSENYKSKEQQRTKAPGGLRIPTPKGVTAQLVTAAVLTLAALTSSWAPHTESTVRCQLMRNSTPMAHTHFTPEPKGLDPRLSLNEDGLLETDDQGYVYVPIKNNTNLGTASFELDEIANVNIIDQATMLPLSTLETNPDLGQAMYASMSTELAAASKQEALRQLSTDRGPYVPCDTKTRHDDSNVGDEEYNPDVMCMCCAAQRMQSEHLHAQPSEDQKTSNSTVRGNGTNLLQKATGTVTQTVANAAATIRRFAPTSVAQRLKNMHARIAVRNTQATAEPPATSLERDGDDAGWDATCGAPVHTTPQIVHAHRDVEPKRREGASQEFQANPLDPVDKKQKEPRFEAKFEREAGMRTPRSNGR